MQAKGWRPMNVTESPVYVFHSEALHDTESTDLSANLRAGYSDGQTSPIAHGSEDLVGKARRRIELFSVLSVIFRKKKHSFPCHEGEHPTEIWESRPLPRADTK